MKLLKNNWYLLSILILICIDQVTKAWAQTQGWVNLNPGVSFGLLFRISPVILTALLVLFVFVGMTVWKRWQLPLGAGAFFWAGAISNIVDRVLVAGVRDWLPIPLTGISNNIADWWIAVGVGVLLCIEFQSIVQKKIDS